MKLQFINEMKESDSPKCIEDVIYKMAQGFKELQFEVPASINLKSHDEGMRLLGMMMGRNEWSAALGSSRLGKPIHMADGSVYMEMEMMGIKIRWPANQYATPSGNFYG